METWQNRELKTDEFLRAIKEYSDGLHKDFAMAVNKKMRDAAFKSARASPVAVKQSIQILNNPKLAAWALSKKPLERVRVKYRHLTGKIGNNWNKKYTTYYRNVSRHYSRQEAKKWLRAVIGRRKAAVTYMKAFFLNLASGVEDATPGLEKRSRHYKSGGFKIIYKPAKSDDLFAYGSIQYEYLHNKKPTTKFNQMITETWIVGMEESTAETLEYLRKKMSEKAAAHSVK